MAPLSRIVSENKFSLLTVQEVPETESSEKRLPEKKKEETWRIVRIQNVRVGQGEGADAPTSIKAIPGYRFALNVVGGYEWLGSAESTQGADSTFG
jgi:hypothetical protein